MRVLLPLLIVAVLCAGGIAWMLSGARLGPTADFERLAEAVFAGPPEPLLEMHQDGTAAFRAEVPSDEWMHRTKMWRGVVGTYQGAGEVEETRGPRVRALEGRFEGQRSGGTLRIVQHLEDGAWRLHAVEPRFDRDPFAPGGEGELYWPYLRKTAAEASRRFAEGDRDALRLRMIPSLRAEWSDGDLLTAVGFRPDGPRQDFDEIELVEDRADEDAKRLFQTWRLANPDAVWLMKQRWRFEHYNAFLDEITFERQ